MVGTIEERMGVEEVFGFHSEVEGKNMDTFLEIRDTC